MGGLRLGVMAVTALAVCGLAGRAVAQDYHDEDPIPAKPQQDLTPIESLFRLTPQAALSLFPQMRDQLNDAPAFIRDARFSINPRYMYFDRVISSPNDVRVQEAFAGGGSLAAETGKLFDVLSFGTVVYATFPIYAPLDYGGSLLLQPDQGGFAVPGQLYGRLHLNADNVFTVGRYLYNTPYMGPQDNRMIPNTFSGYTLTGSIGDGDKVPQLSYGAGYISSIKPRDSATFVSMSRRAGTDVDYGLAFFAGRMNWGSASIGAVEYFCQDTLNVAYVEADYGLALTNSIYSVLALQYADQRSVGANLTNGGKFYQTNQFGARLELGYQTGILALAYSTVNPDYAMVFPWSANPIYTNGMILPFVRPGENAVMAGLSYVFTPLGLPGVAASAFYFNGWTTSLAAGAPLNESEWDFNLEWRPDFKPLQGLWLRARYATAVTDQNSVRTTANDLRFILNYTLRLY